MKIATWNVNSLRVRLPQVLDWLEQRRPDILCLQETKITDEDFPEGEIREHGYEVAYSGQRAYNGVAIISTSRAAAVVTGLPQSDDDQRRVLVASVAGVRVLNVYVPNGQEVDSPKYRYKLDWLDNLLLLVEAELSTHDNVVLLGDFNIAPEEADVHDPERWRGKVLFSDPERAAFRKLVQTGLMDCFRKFDQPGDTFSWWDYRAAAFRRNRGLRIDHILASPSLYEACRSCGVDKGPRKLARPSDHAPVFAEFEI